MNTTIDPLLAENGATEDPETCCHPSVGPVGEDPTHRCVTCLALPESWVRDDEGRLLADLTP